MNTKETENVRELNLSSKSPMLDVKLHGTENPETRKSGEHVPDCEIDHRVEHKKRGKY